MSDRFCSINGDLIKVADTRIAPTDRSFALGDGLFETVRVFAGKPVWLNEHLSRMESSARFAGIHFPDKGKLESACKEVIDKNETLNGFLRITLSRGISPTGRFGDKPEESFFAIIAGSLNSVSEPMKAGLAPWPVNESDPSIRHKTTSRFSAVIASQIASERGLDELIFVNSGGELTEGITSNIFWSKNGNLFTPATECGLLPGITRGKVIEQAKKTGIEVSEDRFAKEEIFEADELFFTNSVVGARSCSEFEGKLFAKAEIANHICELLKSRAGF